MRPSHQLKVYDKENGYRTTVGAGWANPNGSITIKLNPAVTLLYKDCLGLTITLFPEKEKEEEHQVCSDKPYQF